MPRCLGIIPRGQPAAQIRKAPSPVSRSTTVRPPQRFEEALNLLGTGRGMIPTLAYPMGAGLSAAAHRPAWRALESQFL
jgi:hypothetical protein